MTSSITLPHTAQSQHNITQLLSRSIGSNRFYNHGEGPYYGLLLVEIAYLCFHISVLNVKGHVGTFNKAKALVWALCDCLNHGWMDRLQL